MGELDAFAAAVGRGTAPPAPAPVLSAVTVLGAGPDARLIAALALAAGKDVTLFSAYGAEIEALAGGIALRGAGPVGSYQVNRADAPSIRATAELDRAVAGAEAIFLTGPVHKQRTYAMVLADHLRDGQMLVLAPGRSFGALEARWLLEVGGCDADLTLVETQGLPFWWVEAGATLHLSEAGPVTAATCPADRVGLLAALDFLPGLVPATTALHASFADGSGLVEAPALLLGGPAVGDGRPAVPMGGTPLPENESFRALIGPAHEAAIAALAAERSAAAAAFGIRDLPGADEMIATHAGAPKGDGARPLPADPTALLRDTVIASLVPLASAARIAGTPAPMTEAMIALAATTLGANLMTAGRRLESLGIPGDLTAARRALEARAKGG